jgi:hypothetical protein
VLSLIKIGSESPKCTFLAEQTLTCKRLSTTEWLFDFDSDPDLSLWMMNQFYVKVLHVPTNATNSDHLYYSMSQMTISFKVCHIVKGEYILHKCIIVKGIIYIY